jgi:hypothetical protein
VRVVVGTAGEMYFWLDRSEDQQEGIRKDRHSVDEKFSDGFADFQCGLSKSKRSADDSDRVFKFFWRSSIVKEFEPESRITNRNVLPDYDDARA